MIPAIVLAAGKSSRMGRPKAALPLAGGDTFITRIVRTLTAAGVPDVVVVVGHDADGVIEALARSDLSATFVENPDYERGQLSSLVAGLRVVDRPGVVAALVTLVDVPLFSASTVRAVIDRYRATHAPIVRPVRGAEHGHPVLIDRSLFDALRHADPERGARDVVRSHASAQGDVPVEDAGAFADADTPIEYERLRSAEAPPEDADTVADAKRRLRAAARRERAAAYARHGATAAARLAGHGLAFARVDRAAVVSGFSAIGDEISALPLLTAAGRLGHRLCLPAMQGRGQPLLFRTWSPGEPTREAVWGIEEPLPSALEVEPDVLLVPLLAFDGAGYRLGYGGGFYDRTLAGLRARKHVIAIGLAFDEQRVESVPHTADDERLDWILTPAGPLAAMNNEGLRTKQC